MKHIKHHPLKDKQQKLSKDMKKQDLRNPKKDKKLETDEFLSDVPKVSKKHIKPSNKKLSTEELLSDDGHTKIKKTNEFFYFPPNSAQEFTEEQLKHALGLMWDIKDLEIKNGEKTSSKANIINDIINNLKKKH